MLVSGLGYWNLLSSSIEYRPFHPAAWIRPLHPVSSIYSFKAEDEMLIEAMTMLEFKEHLKKVRPLWFQWGR